MTSTVSIIEVGPRDGLQNVKELLSLEQKKALIAFLLKKGFTDVEAGSFVRPDLVPAMQDTPQLAHDLAKQHQNLWYLVPNLVGLEKALAARASQLAFFTAASTAFNQKNIGVSLLKSIDHIQDCIEHLRDNGYHILQNWQDRPVDAKHVKLRLYISTVIGCPFEGKIAPKKTVGILESLMHLGFSQVSLGDTIGVGVPRDWKMLLESLDTRLIKNNQIAMHCHNTYGTALACVAAGLEMGVRSFDAAIGGLGGCPFAPGASGNLATEDLVYFLGHQGVDSGFDVNNLLDVFSPERTANLVNHSMVARALKRQ